MAEQKGSQRRAEESKDRHQLMEKPREKAAPGSSYPRKPDHLRGQ
ncbi:hypothetical protein [Planifilum fimeticola]|nr:hypothetical protein [Planifilum fimeticola]